MKRSEEHVTSFIFAELGTSGSVDGSRRLVIKGRFQQKQIENVLRRYVGMYTPSCSLLPAASDPLLPLSFTQATCHLANARQVNTSLAKHADRQIRT